MLYLPHKRYNRRQVRYSTFTDTVYVVLAVLIRTNVDGNCLHLTTIYAVSGTICTVFFAVSVP